jgi:hypothetical protein
MSHLFFTEPNNFAYLIAIVLLFASNSSHKFLPILQWTVIKSIISPWRMWFDRLMKRLNVLIMALNYESSLLLCLSLCALDFSLPLSSFTFGKPILSGSSISNEEVETSLLGLMGNDGSEAWDLWTEFVILFDLIGKHSVVNGEVLVDLLHKGKLFLFFKFGIRVIFEAMLVEVVKVASLEMKNEALLFQLLYG